MQSEILHQKSGHRREWSATSPVSLRSFLHRLLCLAALVRVYPIVILDEVLSLAAVNYVHVAVYGSEDTVLAAAEDVISAAGDISVYAGADGVITAAAVDGVATPFAI